MGWWSDISKRADEIEREVRRHDLSRPVRRPVIRDEVDARDESIAEIVSMGRMLARGLHEAARLVREDRAAERKRDGQR